MYEVPVLVTPLEARSRFFFVRHTAAHRVSIHDTESHIHIHRHSYCGMIIAALRLGSIQWTSCKILIAHAVKFIVSPMGGNDAL